MPSPHDTAQRLAALEQILAQTTAGATTAGDAADLLLTSVATERIRRLTAELQATQSRQLDAVDTLVLRILLNEYSNAVGRLRAVARMAAASVDGAATPMRRARRTLHRFNKTLGRFAAGSGGA